MLCYVLKYVLLKPLPLLALIITREYSKGMPTQVRLVSRAYATVKDIWSLKEEDSDQSSKTSQNQLQWQSGTSIPPRTLLPPLTPMRKKALAR